MGGIGWGVVSNRELVVLGTASQAPTRSRNHNGYFLRWDGEGLLFDPGEGTQRQMLFAGVTASQITRICITHLHGDHCLGLPGVLARMSLDRVPHPVEVCYPAGSREVFGRLRHASLFRDVLDLRERRVRGRGARSWPARPPFRLEARALSHSVPTVGYRLTEPDGRRMLPDKLAAPGHRRSRHRAPAARGPPGGRRPDGDGRAGERAEAGAAFRVHHGHPAVRRGLRAGGPGGHAGLRVHLRQRRGRAGPRLRAPDRRAGRADRGAGRGAAARPHPLLAALRVRPGGDKRLAGEAAAVFGGEVVLASDLDRIPVPPRRGS